MAAKQRDDRGQVQTIEALISSFIMLMVLAVVVQSTSVTPLTTSFTNQHVKYELQSMSQDILASLDEIPHTSPANDYTPSRLERSVKDWLAGTYVTPTGTVVTGKPGDWYTYNGVDKFVSATGDPLSPDREPCTYLERALTFAFSESGIAYNVEVRYPDNNGEVYSAKMIWNGDPSDNCVTVSRYVTLHDDVAGINDQALLIDGAATNYLIPDISTGSYLHNVVEVRLTVWVM